MTKGMTGLAAGSMMLLGMTAANAADLYSGHQGGSIKDAPVMTQRACSGDRFAGFYAGGNVGLSNLNTKWQETFADFKDYQDLPHNQQSSDVTGGIQAGYNLVRCNFLIGLEADYNWSNIRHNSDLYPGQFSSPLSYLGYANVADGIKNTATLRGRMGVVRDRTLFYGTAGLAWGNLTHKMTDYGHFDGSPEDSNGNINQSGWKQGYVVGAGFEHALSELVSLKTEALYMNFGKQTYGFSDRAPPPFPVDPYSFSHSADMWSVRVGLNVKLGNPSRGCGHDCDASPMK